MKKSSNDFRFVLKYDVLYVDGESKLIVIVPVRNGDIKYYVTSEELFDILYDTHVRVTGHGGRDGMSHELNRFYKNITLAHISIFLRLCEICQQKKKWLS